MKRYKLSNKIIALALLSTFIQADEVLPNAWYVGTYSSITNLASEEMTIENKNKSKSKYHDIKGSSHSIKVGYRHFDGNRVELYYKGNEFKGDEGKFSTESLGVNYEWGFTSLSSKKLLPYLSLGFGVGEVTSSNIKAIDKSDIGEIIFGIGLHYTVNEDIVVQVGYNRTGTIVDNFYDEATDDISAVGQDNIMLGLSYVF